VLPAVPGHQLVRENHPKENLSEQIYLEGRHGAGLWPGQTPCDSSGFSFAPAGRIC
jgi:hypothetical protein